MHSSRSIHAMITVILSSMFTVHPGLAQVADYSVYPHLTGSIFLEGENQDMTGFSLWGDDYFAVCNEDAGLVIYRFGGEDIWPVGLFDGIGEEHDVEVTDWTAFVAGSGGLTAVSIAAPQAPFSLGFIHLASDVTTRLALSATQAYVACGSAGLAVVDITNPSSMYVTDWYGSDVTSVNLNGSRLAITNLGRAEILDVSAPVPVLLGYCETVSAFDYHDAVLVGDFLYSMAGAQIDRWDFSDPSSPALDPTNPFLTLPMSSGGRLSRVDNEVIVAANSYLGFVEGLAGDLLRESGQVWLPRDLAFTADSILASSRDAIQIYRNGWHANPAATGVIEPEGFMVPGGIIQGDILYGTSLSDPTVVTSADLSGGGAHLWDLDTGFPGGIQGFGHQGNLLAVLGGSPLEVRLYSVSRFGPVTRGAATIPGVDPDPRTNRQVGFFSENRLAVLEPYNPTIPGRVLILDTSDPDAPTIISNYFFSGYAYGMQFTDTCLVLERASYLEIIETENWGVVGELRPGGQFYFTKDSFLFSVHTALYGARLDYWDLSDPTNPVQAGELALSNLKGFVVEGDFAYQEGTGLILDLSDPAHPVGAGNLSLANPGVNPMKEILPGSQYVLTGDFTTVAPFTTLHYLPAQGASGEVSSVRGDIPDAPGGLGLKASPNPFNPAVTLKFNLGAASETSVEIFDIRGRQVADLGTRKRETGTHVVTWDGTGRGGRALPSGIYFGRVRAGAVTETVKVVLAK